MKSFETLILEKNDTVLTIIFNRPEKANAMNRHMLEELLEVITDLRYDKDISFVVFKGKGNHFSAGADLNEMVENYEDGTFTAESGRKDQFLGQEIMSKLEELEQITFSTIHGACIGGGLALALACDFRIISENVSFSIPEIQRGTFFAWGSTLRLINTVGVTKAKEMILLTEPVDAKEALTIHLATKVVEKSQLDEEVAGLIERMSHGPFTPIRMTKKLTHAAGMGQINNLTIFETELFEQALLTGEPLKEISRFVNRDRSK